MNDIKRRNYIDLLNFCKFNPEQIDFLVPIKDDYDWQKKENKDFYYDGWERDMWYKMNQSGLFEDVPENKTGITHWMPNHTRMFISEVRK